MGKFTNWLLGREEQPDAEVWAPPAPSWQAPAAPRPLVGETSLGSGRALDTAHAVRPGSAAAERKRLSLEKDIDDTITNRADASRIKGMLRKTSLTLEKYDLSDHIAMVGLLVDISKSMLAFYRDGLIQQILEVFQVLGLEFDDNGALDTFLFSDSCVYCGELKLETLTDFVPNHFKRRESRFVTDEGEHIEMRGTSYVAGLEAVHGLYRERLAKGPANDGCDRSMPMVIIWVTDGAPNKDEHAAILKKLDAMSDDPIYLVVLAINNIEFGSDFSFLANMATRRPRLKVLNIAIRRLPDLGHYKIDEHVDDLNEMLVGDYPRFIQEAKAAQVLLEA